MSEWDFRWQESKNPPPRPLPGRWRRPRPQGLADCFPGNISAVVGGDQGTDVAWQGELRPGSAAAEQLADFGIGEPVVARRVCGRTPDETFPLPPWPRPYPATAPAGPFRSDDSRNERS